MGRYKDREGKTRLGKLIEKAQETGKKIPPEVLDIAGIFLPPVAKVRAAIEALKKDPEVDPYVKDDLIQAIEELETSEEQITTRHKTDMLSDNMLSKNFRPVMGAILVFFWMYAEICTGYHSKVVAEALLQGKTAMIHFDERAMDCIRGAAILAISFYFGGRQLEKLLTIYKSTPTKNG